MLPNELKLLVGTYKQWSYNKFRDPSFLCSYGLEIRGTNKFWV